MDKKNPWEFTGPEICTAVAPGRDPLGGLGKEIQEEWMAGFWYNIYMVLLWIINIWEYTGIYRNIWEYMGYYGNILFKHALFSIISN